MRPLRSAAGTGRIGDGKIFVLPSQRIHSDSHRRDRRKRPLGLRLQIRGVSFGRGYSVESVDGFDRDRGRAIFRSTRRRIERPLARNGRESRIDGSAPGVHRSRRNRPCALPDCRRHAQGLDPDGGVGPGPGFAGSLKNDVFVQGLTRDPALWLRPGREPFHLAHLASRCGGSQRAPRRIPGPACGPLRGPASPGR